MSRAETVDVRVGGVAISVKLFDPYIERQKRLAFDSRNEEERRVLRKRDEN